MKDSIIGLDVPILWTPYMNNTMATCVNKYALKTIADSDIRNIYEQALEESNKNIQHITEIFKNENFPIPHGFTDEDVYLNAPRLFSDEFLLFYLHEMTSHGLTAYSLGITTSHKLDVRDFFVNAHNGALELYKSTLEIMELKGILERTPTIMLPEKVEFVKKQSFLAGWFGDHRPLNVFEISSLYFNLRKSIMAKALALGFSQTAQAKDIRSFMLRVVETAEENITIFSSKLNDDFVSSTISWDTHVTDSQIAPFSDKLMMVHAGFLIQSAVAYYGTAFSSSMRRDLGAHYTAAISRVAKIAEDGMNIMIANGWFEEPPHTVDRNELPNR